MSTENRERYRTLGLVQVAIMNQIASSPERAYGTAIADDASKAIGRELADGQVYVALKRLEHVGLLSSRIEQTDARSNRRRGHPRKYYSMTIEGKRELEDAVRCLSSIYHSLQSAQPKLTPDQRRIKSDAWKVLDYNRPRLEEL